MPGTFVTLGNASQPFGRLISAIDAQRQALPAPVHVQHGTTPCAAHWASAVPFLSPADYDRCVRQADVVITHAGAGSILNAIQAGKVPIVMPRLSRLGEILDDHQVEFADALEAAGRVLVVRDPADVGRLVDAARRRQSALSASPAEPRLVSLVDDALRRVEREAGG